MEKASWKRMLIALYLDVLIFGVATYYIGVIILNIPSKLTDYAPVALALLSFLMAARFDPGRRIMSIDAEGMVPSTIRERGNWLVILLGVLFVLDGTKAMIRWHQLGSEIPYFGLVPDPRFAWLIATLWGGLFICAGVELLLVRARAFYLVLVAILAGIVSAFAGASIWDRSIAETVRHRRAAQGMPVRDGEIELMQSVFPEVMVVIGAILLIALFAVRGRLRATPVQA